MGCSLISLSSPDVKNFSLRDQVETALLSRAVPPHKEGRFAIVTDVRRDAMDALALDDEGRFNADGKVVWS
jgi:hypothetical protein